MPQNGYHNEWLTFLVGGKEAIPTFIRRPDRDTCWRERRNIGNRTSAVHEDCTDTENAINRKRMKHREGTTMMDIVISHHTPS
jgi:hypothetical protein